jgi:hypothetical protein
LRESHKKRVYGNQRKVRVRKPSDHVTHCYFQEELLSLGVCYRLTKTRLTRCGK